MENQAYHIQILLVDKLDSYKEKRNKYAEEHIKEIQDTYKQEDLVMKIVQIIDKEKQQVQDEKILLINPIILMNLNPRYSNQLLSKTRSRTWKST